MGRPASSRISTVPVCLAVLALALALPVTARGPLSAGDSAPPFTLRDMSGRAISLDSFRGRPVVLHFWATWCPHCVKEMPLLEEMARAHGERSAILCVNLAEKKKKVAAYLQESHLTLPVLLDARGNVAQAYGVIALPTTIVVGADGRIRGEIAMGSLTREGLEEWLKE